VLDNPKSLITRLAYTQGRLDGRSGRPGTDEELATVLRDAASVLGDAIDAIKEAALQGLIPTAPKAPSENAKLYPEGRVFYYEGDLPTECVDMLVGVYGLEPSISFHCPADMLDEVEGFFSDYPHALGT
jgi:hypothetical protein